MRNVELPLIYSGFSRSERRKRALVALESVGLANKAENGPSQLSGGQQQRVAVARALVTDPAMVLADEPTGNLDSASTTDVIHLLEELNMKGRTIVLITHEDEVSAHSKRRLVLVDGQIVVDERAAGVHDAPPRYVPRPYVDVMVPEPVKVLQGAGT